MVDEKKTLPIFFKSKDLSDVYPGNEPFTNLYIVNAVMAF